MRRVSVAPAYELVSRDAAPLRQNAPARGSLLTPQVLLELQRTGGNRAVQRLLAAPAERTLARFNDQLVRERAYQVKDWVEAKIQVRAHEIFTATGRPEQANYYEAKQQVEEAWQHFTTLESGGTVTSEQWKVMKLGLSSDEYSRALALQGTAMTQAELLELTVGDFDKHRKRAQMDWANAGFDDPTRKMVWEIVDWGLDGLATIKLADVVKEMANSTSVNYIKHYCEAITGKLNGGPTVELARQNALPDVLRHGKWVGEADHGAGRAANPGGHAEGGVQRTGRERDGRRGVRRLLQDPQSDPRGTGRQRHVGVHHARQGREGEDLGLHGRADPHQELPQVPQSFARQAVDRQGDGG